MNESITCWICNQSPVTGEHKIKRSDLKYIFNQPTQKDPLYFREYNETCVIKERKLGGFDNTILKMTNICAKCNNEVTQPHDKSWERLSTVLRESYLKKSDVVRTNKIFKYNTKKYMLNVHLYFVKHFGCYITKNTAPINIKTFATSILNNKAHPNLFLQFGIFSRQNNKFAGATAIYLTQASNGFLIAEYSLCISDLVVKVIVADGEDIDNKFKDLIDDSWHPHRTSKITIFNFN